MLVVPADAEVDVSTRTEHLDDPAPFGRPSRQPVDLDGVADACSCRCDGIAHGSPPCGCGDRTTPPERSHRGWLPERTWRTTERTAWCFKQRCSAGVHPDRHERSQTKPTRSPILASRAARQSPSASSAQSARRHDLGLQIGDRLARQLLERLISDSDLISHRALRAAAPARPGQRSQPAESPLRSTQDALRPERQLQRKRLRASALEPTGPCFRSGQAVRSGPPARARSAGLGGFPPRLTPTCRAKERHAVGIRRVRLPGVGR